VSRPEPVELPGIGGDLSLPPGGAWPESVRDDVGRYRELRASALAARERVRALERGLVAAENEALEVQAARLAETGQAPDLAELDRLRNDLPTAVATAKVQIIAARKLAESIILRTSEDAAYQDAIRRRHREAAETVRAHAEAFAAEIRELVEAERIRTWPFALNGSPGRSRELMAPLDAAAGAVLDALGPLAAHAAEVLKSDADRRAEQEAAKAAADEAAQARARRLAAESDRQNRRRPVKAG